MTPRLPVAIGDIHGRLDLLNLMLSRFPDRQYVFLGDLTDRGPDSPGVVARVRDLVEEGRAICCMGNHDEMMIQAVIDGNGSAESCWELNGGQSTQEQYPSHAALLADAQWMRDSMLPWHVEGHVLFSHAMRPHPSDPEAHLWGRPTTTPLYPLPEGVTHSIHGHTPMDACPFPFGAWDGSVAWFIDTGAVWTGRLCALDTETMTPTIVEVFVPAGQP
ncbi:metallophosphoesterase family protein (plasmid) [Deinococcus radiomollis]|uniref:metallophosphoesterase family protein n=1 Tax=Deinococcus radiomollis TaxID=468916 RepID=UPI003891224F